MSQFVNSIIHIIENKRLFAVVYFYFICCCKVDVIVFEPQRQVLPWFWSVVQRFIMQHMKYNHNIELMYTWKKKEKKRKPNVNVQFSVNPQFFSEHYSVKWDANAADVIIRGTI